MSSLTSLSESNPTPRLKEFVFEKKLGSGTYACVYRCYNKKNPSEICAIKCIKKAGLNKGSTENLLREIKILKQIKHEHIVQLKDFQWDENYIYIILEYCAGGDLSNFIKSRRTIPEKYVKRFVQQIASALKHLHSKEIAHMDLKPQNILLTSTNNPTLKLADFGFAQYMTGADKSRSLRGSPLYMGPEILKNKVYDSKVDLWSVGVILHEILFGYAPFVSNSMEELESKIMDDTPVQIPAHINLSENCKDLLYRLLKRNPQERINFEEFFNHPFVDLDHMPSNQSLPKFEMVKKALIADEKNNYSIAQRFYLQAIEYLIPAIQYEHDERKKQEIREKAKIYIKRAEELGHIIKSKSNLPNSFVSSEDFYDNKLDSKNSREPKSSRIVSIPVYYEKPQKSDSEKFLDAHILPINTNDNLSLNPSSQTILNKDNNIKTSSSHDFFQSQNKYLPYLLTQLKDNEEILKAIRNCLDADEKFQSSSSRYEVLLKQYQDALSIMMPFVKNLSKESELCKSFKISIDMWLSNAEKLKELINAEGSIDQLNILRGKDCFEEDADNNQHIKQCILQ